MIENLENLYDDIMEGTFKSVVFKNDGSDELSVVLENKDIEGYAELCIKHFNSMPDRMVDDICRYIIKSSENGGLADDFELPELGNVRNIFGYCWFTTMSVEEPENDEIAYTIEGEGDWGECIYLIIRGDKVLYVGTESDHSVWEDEDYYKALDDNCVY